MQTNDISSSSQKKSITFGNNLPIKWKSMHSQLATLCNDLYSQNDKETILKILTKIDLTFNKLLQGQQPKDIISEIFLTASKDIPDLIDQLQNHDICNSLANYVKHFEDVYSYIGFLPDTDVPQAEYDLLSQFVNALKFSQSELNCKPHDTNSVVVSLKYAVGLVDDIFLPSIETKYISSNKTLFKTTRTNFLKLKNIITSIEQLSLIQNELSSFQSKLSTFILDNM